MRFVVILLGVALAFGVAPATSAAADGAESGRTLEDAVRLELTADAWVVGAGSAAGLISEAVAASAMRAISEHELNVTKQAQRELGRRYRRERRTVSDQERFCLDHAYRQEYARLQAAVVAGRASLGYVDRRKGITKLSRFVGSVIKETIDKAGPELIAAYFSGGLGGGVGKAIFKRNLGRVAQGRGQDAIMRVVLQRAGGPTDAALTAALAACLAREGTPTPDTTPDTAAQEPVQTPAAEQGTDATVPGCTTWTEAARLPPYDVPAVLVRFSWDERDDVGVQYHAERSGNPSNAWSEPFWSGGCRPGSGWCNPLQPLVFTTAEVGGYNWESVPGTYTVMALPAGACQDTHEHAYETIPSFEVSALIEYYDAGASEPSYEEDLRTVVLRNHVDIDTRTEPNPDRREMGTFDWDPTGDVISIQSEDEQSE